MYYLIAILVFLLNLVFDNKKQPPRYWYNEKEKIDSVITKKIDSLKYTFYDIQN